MSFLDSGKQMLPARIVQAILGWLCSKEDDTPSLLDTLLLEEEPTSETAVQAEKVSFTKRLLRLDGGKEVAVALSTSHQVYVVGPAAYEGPRYFLVIDNKQSHRIDWNSKTTRPLSTIIAKTVDMEGLKKFAEGNLDLTDTDSVFLISQVAQQRGWTVLEKVYSWG